MKYLQLRLSDIQYIKKEYTTALYDSIIRIGFSLPISVIYKNHRYICVDGHKRLSVLYDILQYDCNYKRQDFVYVIVKNSDDVHSNDCWRGRNSH